MTFPPCLVITCRESTAPAGRAELVRAHFAEHDVPATFVQGVHGRTWGLDTRCWHHRDSGARDELVGACRDLVQMAENGATDAALLSQLWTKALRSCRCSYRIDAGHIGLCLSHWMVWQIAWHAGYEEVLVCEDDVDLLSGFRERFLAQRAALPADWQVWYVGCINAHECRPHSGQFRVPAGCPFGTHCMLIRRSALPVLLDRCVGAYTHVDQLIGERALPHLRTYVSHPTLAVQRSYDGRWPHAVGGYYE